MNMKLITIFGVSVVLSLCFISGCHKTETERKHGNSITMAEETTIVTPTEEIVELEDGFSVVSFEGAHGFDDFLKQGGAASDRGVVQFLTENMLSGVELGFFGGLFGCSTLSTQNQDGEALFGRNFDWEKCQAMVVTAKPDNAYASISTVNMDFVTSGTGLKLNRLPDRLQTLAALYAPLDGMNERGLCVAANMIQDSTDINQISDRPDLTTTTAIRLLLDKAATTDEALDLLQSYDMHASMGMMVHFVISDAADQSVVVEYIDNEFVVIETPVVTNFYLAEGEKNGIGTKQSHERYEILMSQIEETPLMNAVEVRNALDRVSKDNFDEFESTEWSIVFNQSAKTACYYHRENYERSYTISIK